MDAILPLTSVDSSGALQLGPYVFHQRLGEGGSGQVWRATGPAGEVAVKILGPGADLDDAARARFGREVAALARLDHPNLVRLLDHGVDDELGPYLVLPVLAGVTLRALAGGAALGPDAAVLLARPIAAAAAALHAAGYVHRDLKPENAMIAADGALTVIDLGLAWRDDMTRHTDTGTAVGSVGYMAPEQIEGHRVDAAADVWAIGVMLYEWTCGKRPFARPRASEEATAALVGAFTPLDRADRRAGDPLAALVARCLAPDAQARPTAAEVAQALTAMADARGDDDDAARAALVAAPTDYSARVAPARVATLERDARAALADGRPFAALALCDRAMAYAPERAELVALVAEVEAATVTAAAPAVVAPAVVTDAPTRHARWPWRIGAVAGAAALAVMSVWLLRDEDDAARPRAATAPNVEVTTTTDPGAAEGLSLAKDLFSLFGRAMDADDERRAAVAAGRAIDLPAHRPTTAAGWMALAEQQPAAEALLSVRQALALQPTWRVALERQCRLLTDLDDPGARAACAALAATSAP